MNIRDCLTGWYLLVPRFAPAQLANVNLDNTYTAFTAVPPHCELIAPGDGLAYYDARNVPHGTVTREVYQFEVTQGEAEKSLARCLNDPDVNKKVDDLFVGQGPAEASGWLGERCIALHHALTKHTIKHEDDVGGERAHDWSTWRHLLHYRFLPNLWRQNSTPPA